MALVTRSEEPRAHMVRGRKSQEPRAHLALVRRSEPKIRLGPPKRADPVQLCQSRILDRFLFFPSSFILISPL